METCGPNSRSRVFVLVAIIAPFTPSLLLSLPRVFGRVTESPPYSPMVSNATLALLNPFGPNLALPRLSYMTSSLATSRAACGATRHNMHTSGTFTSLLMRTWLRGQAPSGCGTSRSFPPTSLKLYVALPSQLVNKSHYFRGRRGTSPTPPSSSRTYSLKS